MTDPATPLATPQDTTHLASENARLQKVVKALMDRAERDMSSRTNDFGLFQTAILLEDQVRARTEELAAAVRENERINRRLQRAKEALEQEAEERERAQAALERARDQLVQTEKLASLGSLVAGVAHELNTPLGNAVTVATTLGGLVDEFERQLAAGPLRRQALADFLAQCRDAAQLMEKNAARAATLIGNFKQVAVDQTSTRRRSFDLACAVEEVLSTLRPKLRHTAHRVDVAIPPGIVLDSYPGPLEQIVTNLVTNSLVHGFDGVHAGIIRIDAQPGPGDEVVLCYADNGVGMDERVAKRVFDPFFTTRLGSGGSGLGLYIVYNLVTAVLGGSIALTTARGRGVRFQLRLPRVAPANAAGEDSHAT